MIVRIVKLTFKPAHIEDFKREFEMRKEQICSQKGCESVELLQCIHHSHIFFTYSHWQDESFLNAYRDSILFNLVWGKVKPWFADKPEAWSCELVS